MIYQNFKVDVFSTLIVVNDQVWISAIIYITMFISCWECRNQKEPYMNQTSDWFIKEESYPYFLFLILVLQENILTHFYYQDFKCNYFIQ